MIDASLVLFTETSTQHDVTAIPSENMHVMLDFKPKFGSKIGQMEWNKDLNLMVILTQYGDVMLCGMGEEDEETKPTELGQENITCFAVSSKGYIATVRTEDEICIWTTNGELEHTIPTQNRCTHLVFTLLGSYLVCEDSENHLSVYETSHWERIQKFLCDFGIGGGSYRPACAGYNSVVFMRRWDRLIHVKFSTEGKEEIVIKTGGWPIFKGDKIGKYFAIMDGEEVKIWSVDNQTMSTLTTSVNLNTVEHFEWSPDCAKAVLAIFSRIKKDENEGVLQLWDVETKKCLHKFKVIFSIWDSIRFSPDGRYISCAGGAGGITVCDTQTGEMVTTLKETILARTTEWGPGGETLAVLTQDSRILMLNMNQILPTGTESCQD